MEIVKTENALPKTHGDALQTTFGSLLKEWRVLRKLTQLELALDAEVSQRHISFLESGRSKPSREMVQLLAEVLALPLRERNILLESAGFSAAYSQRPLHGEAMQPVRQALQMQLDHHDPLPAMVVDREWNLLMANSGLLNLFDNIGDPLAMWQNTNPDGGKNIMRLTLHPEGLRHYCENWEILAPSLLQRLRRDAKLTGSTGLVQLLEELKEDSTLDAYWQLPIVDIAPQPVYSMELADGDFRVSLFSMISTFGTPQDITTDELRLELFFPADDATAALLKN